MTASLTSPYALVGETALSQDPYKKGFRTVPAPVEVMTPRVVTPEPVVSPAVSIAKASIAATPKENQLPETGAILAVVAEVQRPNREAEATNFP